MKAGLVISIVVNIALLSTIIIGNSFRTKYKKSIDYQQYKFVIQPPTYSQEQMEMLDATIPAISDTLDDFYEWYPKKVWVNNDTIGVYMVPLRYLQCGLDTFNNIQNLSLDGGITFFYDKTQKKIVTIREDG